MGITYHFHRTCLTIQAPGLTRVFDKPSNTDELLRWKKINEIYS